MVLLGFSSRYQNIIWNLPPVWSLECDSKLDQSHRAITLLESSYGSHVITNSPSLSLRLTRLSQNLLNRDPWLRLLAVALLHCICDLALSVDILTHWHSNLGLFLNKFDPEGFLAEHKEWCADPQAVTNISLD